MIHKPQLPPGVNISAAIQKHVNAPQQLFALADGGVVIGEEVDAYNQLWYVVQRGVDYSLEPALNAQITHRLKPAINIEVTTVNFAPPVPVSPTTPPTPKP